MRQSSTDKRHFVIVGVLIVLTSVLMYWLLDTMLPLPVQASLQSLAIDRLIKWHLGIIAFLFSLVTVFMLYSIVVFRRREGDAGDGEHFEGNTALEIAWTVIPLIAVLVFGFFGVRTLNEITMAHDNEVVVHVEGFQWAWQFTYPEGVISQELVLPVDQPARMEMEARDVLHSFWVPEFRVKQDLVPGQTTHIRFTPTEVGEYQLRCAELCGLSHWRMNAPVRVVEEAEFAMWMEEQLIAQNPALAEQADAAASE